MLSQCHERERRDLRREDQDEADADDDYSFLDVAWRRADLERRAPVIRDVLNGLVPFPASPKTAPPVFDIVPPTAIRLETAGSVIASVARRYYPVPTRINGIDRIMLAVEVRVLVEVGVPRDEPANLCIVVPRAYLHQPGITVVAIPARSREFVWIGRASGRRDGLPEPFGNGGRRHRLAGVGDRTCRSEAIVEEILSVLADQRMLRSKMKRAGMDLE
jgi:hypothetical protein